MEFRCPSKLHAVGVEELIEISCNSRFCGASSGVTVLHRFNPSSGDLVETLQFKNPRKEQADASHHSPASVRSA